MLSSISGELPRYHTIALMYYYNPIKTNVNPREYNNFGVEPTRDLSHQYINNCKFIQDRLNKASKTFRIGKSYLRDCLIHIVKFSSEGIVTMSSQEAIAKEMGCSRKTVQRCISVLRIYKLIITYHRYSKDKSTRRRITSKTIFSAFVKYLKTLELTKIRLTNRELIASIKSNPDGENLYKKPFDPDTGEIFIYDKSFSWST